MNGILQNFIFIFSLDKAIAPCYDENRKDESAWIIRSGESPPQADFIRKSCKMARLI